MKHPVRIMILIISIAFSCATRAEESTSPSTEAPVALPAGDANDWSQTHLFPGPALREQIERANLFLEAQARGMTGEISHLKLDGFLDRRSISKIHSALDHARGSMARITEGIEGEQQVDGWTARMIASELGLAADTLAEQADSIEAELNAGPEGSEGAAIDDSSDVEQRRHLAKTLRQGSSLLKETARAIVRNLE